METQNPLVLGKFWSQTKPQPQARKKQGSKQKSEHAYIFYCYTCIAVQDNANLRKKTKLEKNWCSTKPRYLDNGL